MNQFVDHHPLITVLIIIALWGIADSAIAALKNKK